MRLIDLKPGMQLCVMHGNNRYEAVRVVQTEPYTSSSGRKAQGVRVKPAGTKPQYVISAAKIRPFAEYEAWIQRRSDSMDHALELRSQCRGLNLGLVRDDVQCSVHGDIWPVLRVEATGDKADRLVKFVRETFSGGDGDG